MRAAWRMLAGRRDLRLMLSVGILAAGLAVARETPGHACGAGTPAREGQDPPSIRAGSSQEHAVHAFVEQVPHGTPQELGLVIVARAVGGIAGGMVEAAPSARAT
jgi:hypothetical protein